MKYSILIILLFSKLSFASLDIYKRPSDETVFSGSDLVGIVRVIKGEVIPLEEGGGIQVTAKVLYPIKGTKKDAEIKIFYAADSIGGRYVAALVWDSKLNGYKYFDSFINYELSEIDTIEQSFLDPYKIASARGFKGDIEKSLNGIYYLPSCDVFVDEYCQESFAQIQFFISQNK